MGRGEQKPPPPQLIRQSHSYTMVKAKLTDKPKRPMSAYFLWMNEVGRAEVKKRSPDASITEVSKECGAAWANIEPDTKSKFVKKAEEAKKSFDKKYKEWLADGGEELLAQEKQDKKKGKGKAAARKPVKKPAKKKNTSDEEEEASEEEAEDSDY